MIKLILILLEKYDIRREKKEYTMTDPKLELELKKLRLRLMTALCFLSLIGAIENMFFSIDPWKTLLFLSLVGVSIVGVWHETKP